MRIAGELASAKGRRDEAPNIALAEKLARSRNRSAVAELAELTSKGTKPQRRDAIKVLYELGERAPELISPHVGVFLSLLRDRDNRMVWCAMSALAALADTAPEKLMAAIDDILRAADASSVIAKDKAMAILARLNTEPRFHDILTPVIFQRLATAAVNQTPMYAELTAASL